MHRAGILGSLLPGTFSFADVLGHHRERAGEPADFVLAVQLDALVEVLAEVAHD